MKKRILAAVLCTIMVICTLATLSACANQTKPGATTTNGSDGPSTLPPITDSVEKPTFAEAPFGTEDEPVEISFAIAETDQDGFHLRSIKSEDADLDNAVDAAVATRNAAVEAELGVSIVVNAYETGGLRNSAVRTSLQANDDTYDVICGRQYDDCQLCLDDVLLDLGNLFDNEDKPIDYFHFDQPYWSSYYIDAMTCGKAKYWLTGDLCLRYSGGFYCFFVNSRLYEELLSAEYGSIYEVVKKGDWTYSTLMKMAQMSYEDDGDDKVNTTDRLGLALPVWDNINGLSIAAGVEYCSRNDDGTLNLTFTNNNATLINFMQACYDLITSGYVYNYVADYKTALTDFAGGNSVFVSARLNQAELYLSDMQDEYSIIPCPKLTNEADYRSSVHDGVQLYGINRSSSRIAASAATLELLAYYSYKDIRPVYYDTALKYLYSRDQGAAEMIDMMSEKVYSDFLYIWQFCAQFNGMGSFLRNNVTGAKFSSMLGRVVSKYNDGLTEVQEDIKGLSANE